MWYDISSNSKIRRLEIFNLLPKVSSSWLVPEWSEFLGRLEHLSIYSYGGDNGAGWCTNTLPGFETFFNKLPDTLFAHIKNLTFLKFVAHHDGLLEIAALQLSSENMPSLRVLHWENMTISPVLIKFLNRYTKTFEDFYIRHCISLCAVLEDTDTPTGADLWKALGETNSRLVRVRYQYEDPPPPIDLFDWPAYGVEASAMSEERLARLDKTIEDDKSLIIWPHTDLNEKYGNALFLEKGDDNRKYQLLLKEVQKRREEGKGVYGDTEMDD
ncbi:hypothetical protein FZEAL_4531 [Fusarium zealandicum]|uniref:Uncharacterized protein n=1 Tax=Fusarium zealandicum TaxID=1053134 RepID=A0A8H4UM31_9HYPO|nr:hypothetical protein FZEAL_4531 [Fusarium zealandicum]